MDQAAGVQGCTFQLTLLPMLVEAGFHLVDIYQDLIAKKPAEAGFKAGL
jgi:hypothetical protein